MGERQDAREVKKDPPFAHELGLLCGCSACHRGSEACACAECRREGR